MATVSRSGDDINQIKDLYAQRETEKDKSHQDEIKKLREGYEADIKDLQGLSQKQIDEVRKHDRTLMTEQDQQHQRDIEALKALYRKKLEDANAKNS
jgi:hypothetical protein